MRQLTRVMVVVAVLGPLLLGPAPASATTWGPTTVKCPLCGEEVAVDVPASYGSYIFGWPSRFQLVFWPFTESEAVHFCSHCHLALFMGDFTSLPADKLDDVRKAIAPLRKEQPEGPYTAVPIAYRLAIAEAAYRVLGRDDAFWCHFYRVAGYHHAEAKNRKAARAARRRALELARKMLADNVSDPPRKELLLIVASMQYLTGHAKEARQALAEAARTKVPPSADCTAEQASREEEYLGKLGDDLGDLVRAGKPIP